MKLKDAQESFIKQKTNIYCRCGKELLISNIVITESGIHIQVEEHIPPDTALAPKQFETEREEMEQALVDFGGYSIGYVKDMSLRALQRRYEEVKKTEEGGKE